LADEINRATPRTQSSLLECMAEKQITVDGVTRPLARPFFVIATQNPIETLGTYPLPEAQMDRFLMRISMETPSKEDELNILNRFLKAEPLKELQPVCTAEDIVALSEESKDVYVHPLLMKYIVDIAHTSRDARNVATGISPRGSLALLRACRAYAMVKGRDYVVPEDIKSIAVPVLAHRIVINGSISTISEQKKIIENILNVTPLTTEDWKK
ncbi:MAG: MoxR family ATPase, partial [Clostridia bacterium]|nr:MoxR family ATPase [Clostridia bacterium]